MRNLAIALAAAGVVLHAIVAFGVWTAANDPGRPGSLMEAPSSALTNHAERELEAGLAALTDRSRPPAERIRTYKDHLGRSRVLLIRSLRVNPAQPNALSTLATIDYELSPQDDTVIETTLRRIETAANLAPGVPRVQAQLGELLLRMGYRSESLVYLARSVELDASLSDRAVRVASAYGLDVGSIRAAFPPTSDVYTALRHALEPDGLTPYLGWIETAIRDGAISPTRELLQVYGDVALETGQATRLSATMGAWGPYDDIHVEIVRLMQLSRAARFVGETREALTIALEGQALAPESQQMAVFLGDIARAAAEPDLAVQAYGKGLRLMARRNATPKARAYLYRRIGEVHEEVLRLDLAYDAYEKALQIFPEDAQALARIEELGRGDAP